MEGSAEGDSGLKFKMKEPLAEALHSRGRMDTNHRASLRKLSQRDVLEPHSSP